MRAPNKPYSGCDDFSAPFMLMAGAGRSSGWWPSVGKAHKGTPLASRWGGADRASNCRRGASGLASAPLCVALFMPVVIFCRPHQNPSLQMATTPRVSFRRLFPQERPAIMPCLGALQMALHGTVLRKI